jgi:antitoxin HigA-1
MLCIVDLVTLGGKAVLAHEWMHSEMGAVLDEFIISLPEQLDYTPARRITDLGPRYATGTSQFVAKLLGKHVDDLATCDIAVSLTV